MPQDRRRVPGARSVPAAGTIAGQRGRLAPPGDEARAPGDSPSRIVGALTEAGGPDLVAILGFGSRITRASPGRRSAWDLFVVVERYAGFYQRIRGVVPSGRPPGFLAFLNRLLPPNILHFPEPGEGGAGAKLFVISEEDLAASLSGKGGDHFCRGRLMQRVEILRARDEAARQRIRELLEENRRRTAQWMRPYLLEPFTVESYCRRLLQVSYSQEIRPEPRERVTEVFEAQRAFLGSEYGRILDALADAGDLLRRGERYAYPQGGGRIAGLRSRWYFTRSKARATARWIKYLLTFEGWLDYVAAKIERRQGIPLDITPRERRFPLLLLWPKFFRVLRARRPSSPDGEEGPGAGPGAEGPR